VAKVIPADNPAVDHGDAAARAARSPEARELCAPDKGHRDFGPRFEL